MKLTIIIPTFNEERTVQELIGAVEAVSYPVEHEIIMVDDASSDGTYEKGKKLEAQDKGDRIRILKNAANQGKGFCVRKGIELARGEIIVIQDADNEYNPQDIPKLLEPILAGEADVVYGSRFLNHPYPKGMQWPNWMVNRFLTGLANLLYGLHLTDLHTCYKVFRSDLVKTLPLKENRFAFCPEVTALLAKKKVRFKERPIGYEGRTSKRGKKIKPRDFFFALLTLIRCRFSS